MNLLENIRTVAYIRNPDIRITTEPIVYYWWFKTSCFDKLLDLLNKEIDKGRILTETINGEKYGLLYIGQGVNGNNRLRNYHILDSQNFHRAQYVENGRLSSLRQTLCGLLQLPMTTSKDNINEFMDENCLVDFQICNLQNIDQLEQSEIINHYLPLNYQHTKSILTPGHRRILRDCKRAMRR